MNLIFLTVLSITFTCAIFLIRKRVMLVTVSGDSMYPTFWEGDRLLVLKYRSSHRYQIGQVVVAHPPYPPGEWRGKLYIKRLVGLPGNDVTVSPANLNNQIHIAEADSIDAAGNRIWHLADAHCFIQGESYWSEDCRAWGPIPLQLLIGIVYLKLPNHSNSANYIRHVKNGVVSTKPIYLPQKKDTG